MPDEFDSTLTRLFAQAREPLEATQFAAMTLAKIAGAQRARTRRQILAVAAIVIAAALNLHLLLDQTASAVRWVGELSPAYADLLITPLGWASSMLVGVWVLFRTRSRTRTGARRR